MADINLYPENPKKVIGEYTEFFAGQLPTATDFNRWLAVLIAQGDYNTAWLDLVAQKAGISINELYERLSVLSEIVIPGSGTVFSQRLTAVETAQSELKTDLTELSTDVTEFETDVNLFRQGLNTLLGTANIAEIGDGTITGALSSTFQSVSDGKNTVATTLTNQGVPTQATDTFNIMATNINTVAVNKYTAGFNAGKAEGTVKQMSAFATGEGNPSVSRAVSLTLLANETYFVTVASSGFQERNDLNGSGHNVTFSCPGATVTPIYGTPYETGTFMVYKVETGAANRTATATATTGGDQGDTSYCSVGLCAAYV